MADESDRSSNGGAGGGGESESDLPRRQVYFVTVEWQDEPHHPESTERLARIIAHALEHGHQVEHGAEPRRFVVRVKYDDVASEVEGKVEHRHHQ